jgi:hypothetical protein
MEELTDDLIIDVGGWDSRYTRVLARAVVGDLAIVLLDTNVEAGDNIYRYYTEGYAWTSEEGWFSTAGSGPGIPTGGWNSGLAYACGHDPDEASVIVEYAGERHTVNVQPNGYWIYATALGDPDDHDFPQRVA